jgi:hypothetical protein
MFHQKCSDVGNRKVYGSSENSNGFDDNSGGACEILNTSGRNAAVRNVSELQTMRGVTAGIATEDRLQDPQFLQPAPRQAEVVAGGGATAHLATDGFGDPADLAADPDLEPVGMVVAAIALSTMDAAHGGTCELFEIGDDGTKRMALPSPMYFTSGACGE